ncbi:ubiquinone-dependent pyruvate dehydrogenase [Galbitalea sp. SE-J8]|uniref:ubiquinone-dependent pyruvate dehydrogenase n=1 Tax=Galbitalea sp. SE-J8 TaxID=3054952 RepID=UPI00259C8F69|nr:ubiquinone-dependent pyruvate dehydrogenase [Galbitalea sp. SE-J8]MDM4761592.1 ubiquinone-dependent pyruvate dehydrogenase [Galbitalea sp. SE-J8]
MDIATQITTVLAANGVTRVWGIPGDSLNGFTDAIRTNDDIAWMHVRHEEAAAFAAGADAQVSGGLGVCAGSCGPGNLHLINGLFDANRSRLPVLAIAAQIPTAEIGSTYFQETHPERLFLDCSVFCETVTNASQMPRLLEIAMRTAIEKRGVAVLVLAGDVLLSEAADAKRVTAIRPTRSAIVPSPEELADAAAILSSGRRVTILAGAGVEGAHDEVIRLADTLGAPIVHALRGKEHIEWDNPFDVGMTGLLGFASGYRAMESCDVLLMLGTDFPYQQFYPPKAKIIQVDERGEQLGRRVPLTLGLHGTVRDTALALLDRLERTGHRHHLDDALDHYAKTRRSLDELATPGAGAIHPQYLTRVIDELAAEDAVFVPDVGSPVTWAARYLRTNGRRRLIGSFAHGTMANALPQALGAQAVDRSRQVIALSGDGGLAMLLGELLTISQLELPVNVVVYNNSSLNFVELEMKAAGFVNFGTSLTNPDFAALARALGLHGIRVERADDVRGAIQEALAHDGPTLVDAVVERQELSLPPSIEAAQAKGFALYALRTVMSGRGDELIDLAKANLRQLF